MFLFLRSCAWSAVFCCVCKRTIPAFWIVNLLPDPAACTPRPHLQRAIPIPTVASAAPRLRPLMCLSFVCHFRIILVSFSFTIIETKITHKWQTHQHIRIATRKWREQTLHNNYTKKTRKWEHKWQTHKKRQELRYENYTQMTQQLHSNDTNMTHKWQT